MPGRLLVPSDLESTPETYDKLHSRPPSREGHIIAKGWRCKTEIYWTGGGEGRKEKSSLDELAERTDRCTPRGGEVEKRRRKTWRREESDSGRLAMADAVASVRRTQRYKRR
ncbi:hypothetical protein DPEC_G00040100 [Dallia pectoralis]|uniref:Uncharacterized protein n=1 Tax=Dallia pectoralis TaxID=75939 RepID=A0ACC2HF94_DALPE|nr:hypothetical protein DPEC_G00040100 [Dallia pectoralis]